MNHWHSQTSFKNAEDQRGVRTLSILLLASCAIFLVVSVAGLVWSDWKLVWAAVVGIILLSPPFAFLKSGHIGASSISLMVILIIMTTYIATIGQGIRDIAIVAFPIVFIFAGLAMSRAFLGLCVALTVVAFWWLVFGEEMGWFIPQPILGKPDWAEFVVVLAIMSVAALAVDLLVANLRRSLEKARQEIEQRKRMEDALQENLEKLNQSYQKEKLQRLELEEEAKARGMLIEILGHELRTPLTPLMACSGMLQEILSSQDRGIEKKLVDNMCKGTDSLSQRLEELLELAKFSRGTFTLRKQVVKAGDLVNKTFSQFKPLAEQQSKQLILEIHEDLPEIEADPARLEQVLENLTSNAIKYSPINTRITLRARKADSDLIIEVQDEGMGVSAEEQKQIFNPYHRVQQDTQKYPGIGLGLAVSRQIVEAHGGKIWVESQLGQGSIFIVKLPLNQAPGKAT
jgi:signal transduction histidine kinase